jgi:hypothetical protein
LKLAALAATKLSTIGPKPLGNLAKQELAAAKKPISGF